MRGRDLAVSCFFFFLFLFLTLHSPLFEAQESIDAVDNTRSVFEPCLVHCGENIKIE